MSLSDVKEVLQEVSKIYNIVINLCKEVGKPCISIVLEMYKDFIENLNVTKIQSPLMFFAFISEDGYGMSGPVALAIKFTLDDARQKFGKEEVEKCKDIFMKLLEELKVVSKCW